MRRRHRYAWVLLPLLGWSCAQTAAQPPATQPATRSQTRTAAGPTPAPNPADYPPYDYQTFRLLNEGLARKATTARLARNPNDPEIIADLLTQQRADEALAVLRRTVSAFPERMPQAFEAMNGQSTRLSSRAHGHPQALQEIVNAAKQQLPRLSREDAARVARQLLLIDRQRTCPGENRMENSLRCFLDEYPGTETALLSQVDFIAFKGGPLSDRLAALDQLVREHPGTIVAAKALAQKAFQLSSGNAYSGPAALERRDGDPTPRLLQVLEVINELESGRYPPCEWIAHARTYVPGFFVDQARLASENVDRLVDAYLRFVVTHFTLDPMFPGRTGIGGIVGTTLPRLLQQKGNDADIEPLLDRLEGEVPDRASARYLRAAIYIDWLREGRRERPINRPAVYEKAAATLQTLQAEGDGDVNRRALATLASLYFSEQDYARARDTFRQYLSRYPRTTWSWMAALRIAQSHEALGEWEAAARAYSSVATAYVELPFARVLGHAHAAAMWERLDQFDHALTEQRAALAGWDADYGLAYTIYEFHARRPEDEAEPPAVRSVARDELIDATRRLERSLQQRGGALVERGRWLVLHEAYGDALTPLRRALAGGSSREVASDARYWERRAIVGIALQLAAANNPAQSADQALRELDAAANGPYDFGVFMAEAAKASILRQNGSFAEAETALRAAVDRWESSQRDGDQRPDTDLARDVAAIRDLIVQPPAGSDLGRFAGNAVRDQPNARPLVVVDPDVHVRLADRTVRRVTVYQQFSGAEHVIFLTAEQRAALSGILETLDGRGRPQSRADTSVRAPALANRRRSVVRPLWDRMFPVTEWRPTVGQTPPTIISIEFLNTERTRAAAPIQAASQGTTLLLQKVDGTWRVLELVDSWIS